MEKEKINEKDLEKTAGGYEAFLNESRFTGKALYITENELNALRQEGLVTEEGTKISIKPEKFGEAKKFLDKRGFRGITHVSNNEDSTIAINVLK